MQSITPFLWFDDNAEEAADFYCSLFKGAKKGAVARMQDGKVMTVNFTLLGKEFMALNGGPHYRLTEAFSMFVSVDTQEEVDDLWSNLTSNGGVEQPCGWLKDRFGLSWQIIPKTLMELLGDPDPAKSKRVMETMFTMKKLDISALQKAYQG